MTTFVLCLLSSPASVTVVAQMTDDLYLFNYTAILKTLNIYFKYVLRNCGF